MSGLPNDRDNTDAEMSLAASADEVSVLLGPADANRRLIEDLLGVRLAVRGEGLVIRAHEADAERAFELLATLLQSIRDGRPPTGEDVRHAVREVCVRQEGDVGELAEQRILKARKDRVIVPKTQGQAGYVRAVREHDLTFCIGPAGTGKTYLAMAMAIAALRHNAVSRLVLTRPVVEAGEALGFLPGDMMDKIEPYLRPLHDAAYDMIGPDRFERLMDRRIIEVIPLAYMRGRTINDAFIVLDEAQNTTRVQMKMALTRLGFGSKMVVTGDITQSDLPERQMSGLRECLRLLRGIHGVAICELTRADIVRHDLVHAIVAAYGDDEGLVERHDEQQ